MKPSSSSLLTLKTTADNADIIAAAIYAARSFIIARARQHGVKPCLAEVPALAALVESIPSEPPHGVDFYSDRLHLVKLGSPAHGRLKGLGFPDGPRFGYTPYCNVRELEAPVQIQEFFHQPLTGWKVIQIVILAKPEERASITGELVRYLAHGN